MIKYLTFVVFARTIKKSNNNGGENMAKNRIREYREDKRPYMSQWVLANQVGVSQTMITNWELGYMNPSDKQKVAIAKALGISSVDIFPSEAKF